MNRISPRLALIIVLTSAGVASAEDPSPSPRVVAAWAGGPMEVRVAFDRAVDPALAGAMVGQGVEFGELGRPGGRVGGERGTLKVAAASLLDGGRTLALVVDPHPRETTYKLTLPAVKAPGQSGPGAKVEASYDLGGVEAAWVEAGAEKPTWSGWWPRFDAGSTREALAGSAEHEKLWAAMATRPGRLTLKTLVKLPPGPATLAVEASGPFEANLGSETAKADPAHRASLKADSTGDAIDLSLTLDHQSGPPRLHAASAGQDLPRSAFLLPWAPFSPAPLPLPETPAQFLTGGDPARGRAVFYGEAAKCGNCHKVGGEGGAVGPELTNLSGRDRGWIYQNIVEPSASIHPEFVTFTIALKDGTIAMGVVRAEGANALKVADIDAKQTVIPRLDIEEIRPSTTSIMPVGLLAALGEEKTRDLLAFLTEKR